MQVDPLHSFKNRASRAPLATASDTAWAAVARDYLEALLLDALDPGPARRFARNPEDPVVFRIFPV